MKPPVRRKDDLMVITSPFGTRELNGKRKFHYGVDLRTVDWQTGGPQPIQATEKCVILRLGTDEKENDFIVVKPLESSIEEIKYIHVTLDESIKEIGSILLPGQDIGFSQIKGTSLAHHLHFETWELSGENLLAVDPVLYFKKYNIKYKMKGDNSIKGE